MQGRFSRNEHVGCLPASSALQLKYVIVPQEQGHEHAESMNTPREVKLPFIADLIGLPHTWAW